MSSEIESRTCKPCIKETSPLKGGQLRQLKAQLDEEWKIVNEHHLEKEYSFNDFREALDFANRVGEVAEKENHHPDIFLAYGKVGLKLWTHNIDGLSENDFILAAKVDQARQGRRASASPRG